MRAVIIALISTLIAAPALANDSTAELGAGGLAYITTDDVRMKSEDLFISMNEVRVRYAFENSSDKDVTTLVAFPMPDITGDIDFLDAIPVEDPENFLGFHTTVDGKPVEAKVQQRVSALGVDQTALITGLGLPLAPHLDATKAAMDKLPPEKWDELIHLGLAGIDEFDQGKGWEKHLVPMWTLSTAFYWQQTFPAKSTIHIEHSYKPSVGTTAGLTFLSPDGSDDASYKATRARYCMDDSFLKAVGKAQAALKGDDFLAENRIEYILTTAANWAGAIEKFHLTVDKGGPANLISFCGEGVKKTGPTTFEITKDDFYPERNLDILIVTNSGALPQ